MTPPRRTVAGRRRPRPRRYTGVLAVDPDRRSTGVLVGLTLLALLVAGTTAVGGVLALTRPSEDEPVDAQTWRADAAYVDGIGVCGTPTTVTGSWAVPGDAPAGGLTVVVLDPAGTPLARGPVDPSGSWTLPVRSLGPGRSGVLLLQDGVGPVATAPLVGC